MSSETTARIVTSDRPAALETYLRLDLSQNGPANNDLRRRVGQEAKLAVSEGKLKLTDVIGDTPPFFTPAMASWYARVAGQRAPALEAIKGAFRTESMERGGRGYLFESELDHLQDNYVKARRAAIAQHATNNKADYDRLYNVETDMANARNDYGQMRAELGNRPPKMLNRWAYFCGLLAIGGAEALLNYESFAALKWATPAIATGMTLLIAAALAFSSHCHGTLLKQWEYYFGEYQVDISRGRAYRLFSLGSTALVIALAAVYYARDTYLADMLVVRGTVGGVVDANPLWIIGGSLLGNIIVYLVGVMIAYFMHDANPDYPEKKRELDEKEREYRKLRRSLDGSRQRILDQLKAKLDKDREGIRNTDNVQRRSANYSRSRQWFSDLQQQDFLVQAALQDYRDELAFAISESGSASIEISREDKIEIATIAEFQELPIQLKYL